MVIIGNGEVRFISNKYKKSILSILTLVIIFVGVTGIKSVAKDRDKLIIEFYYFNPCGSCTYGEDFKAKLEEEIVDIIGVDEYEIQLNNTYDESVNLKHQNIIKNISMPKGEVVDLPMIKIKDNYIFGIESIEKNTKNVIEKVNYDR